MKRFVGGSLILLAMAVVGLIGWATFREVPPAVYVPRAAEMDSPDGRMKSWLYPAKFLVEASGGDEEAQAVLAFIEKNGIAGSPIDHNGNAMVQNVGVIPPGCTTPIAICVFTADDVKRLPSWGRDVHADAAGVYRCELNTIILRDKAHYSPIDQGLHLLHEASHAYDYNVKQMRWDKDPAVKWQTEITAYALASRVLGKYAGTAYRAMIEEGAQIMRRNIDQARGSHTKSVIQASLAQMGKDHDQCFAANLDVVKRAYLKTSLTSEEEISHFNDFVTASMMSYADRYVNDPQQRFQVKVEHLDSTYPEELQGKAPNVK